MAMTHNDFVQRNVCICSWSATYGDFVSILPYLFVLCTPTGIVFFLVFFFVCSCINWMHCDDENQDEQTKIKVLNWKHCTSVNSKPNANKYIYFDTDTDTVFLYFIAQMGFFSNIVCVCLYVYSWWYVKKKETKLLRKPMWVSLH